ncbi:MAG: putative lipid II flippase FtsW [Candidatus Nealsonbacteria bacterium]|nr:MAG: putative lipid II flippase FtsW [Candidatus Nealsonbacteria bacterium]
MVKVSGRPDYILFGVVVILVVLGILILASVSASLSQEKFGTTYYFLNHQLLFGLIPGLILAFLAFRIRLDFLKKWTPLLLLINLILLVMVFLPKIGAGAGGATRWLSMGPISFQPAEFLKLTFILYLAAWLTSRTPHQQKSGFGQAGKWFSQTFIAFLIVIGLISLLLIFQPDISTLGVIVLVAVLMYFLANTPLWHSILIILIGAGGLFTLIKLAPYRAARLLVFFEPGTDPMGIGYQLKQALIAIGSGGIFGLGLGMSGQRLGFLPQSISDSIFAIMAEETGFIGSLILISLFLIFLWRGFKIGKGMENKFSQLAAIGISSWIVIQAFINVGSMIGILPLTGIPLPFISYGGSALVTELIGVGILLNISKNTT